MMEKEAGKGEEDASPVAETSRMSETLFSGELTSGCAAGVEFLSIVVMSHSATK